jgi:AraC-like DNA-binding protein
MGLRSHIPAPPLSDFVDQLWYYEGYSQPHAKERLLPDGSIELIFNLTEDQTRVYGDTGDARTFRGSVLSGPHSKFFVIDTAEQIEVIGVHFKPGGAFPFFKLPVGELQDEHVGLDNLWGSKASELRDRLLEAPTPDAKFGILERALLDRTTKPLVRHPAVAFALRQFGAAQNPQNVSEVTEQIGLSARRFIDVFNNQVGLTPKLFCRVRRFQEVLRHLGNKPQVDWTRIALDFGYFDQPHFIHDFRAFSGINPTTYLAHRTEHLNHVPILD